MQNLIVGEIVTSETLTERTGCTEYETETLIQGRAVTDIIGREGLYDTFTRTSLSQPFTYAGECTAGSRINRQAGIAPLIYICSPFRAEDPETARLNVALAKMACRNAIEEGMLPIAPHLYFPNFMNEDDPAERDYGLSAGIRALAMCDKMKVFVIDNRISAGMEAEIWHALYRFRIEPEYIRMTRAEAEEFAMINLKEG